MSCRSHSKDLREQNTYYWQPLWILVLADRTTSKAEKLQQKRNNEQVILRSTLTQYITCRSCTLSPALFPKTMILPTFAKYFGRGRVQSIRPAGFRSVRPAEVQTVRPARVQSIRPARVQSVRPAGVQSIRPARVQSIRPAGV